MAFLPCRDASVRLICLLLLDTNVFSSRWTCVSVHREFHSVQSKEN